jgi:excisionase family DNA binding protein
MANTPPDPRPSSSPAPGPDDGTNVVDSQQRALSDAAARAASARASISRLAAKAAAGKRRTNGDAPAPSGVAPDARALPSQLRDEGEGEGESCVSGKATRQRQKAESRAQMMERLTNPLISLHEASVLLRVCTATVRRMSDSGELAHERTPGGQRRFRLRAVLALLEEREARRSPSRTLGYRPAPQKAAPEPSPGARAMGTRGGAPQFPVAPASRPPAPLSPQEARERLARARDKARAALGPSRQNRAS